MFSRVHSGVIIIKMTALPIGDTIHFSMIQPTHVPYTHLVVELQNGNSYKQTIKLGAS